MENQLLDNDQRCVLAAVADVLIPAHYEMPSATDAGVTENLIDMVLGYRADLVPAFLDALSDCSGKDPSTALDEMAKNSPEKFEALTLLTSAAYFQSAKVKAALNYNPAPRTVIDDVDTYIDMLADVVERGFTIR
ncbi:MAG: hypothetical protein WCQ11_01770 [Actinomycetes bacterium]